MVDNIGEVPEIPKDDTAPSGNTGTQDKGNGAEKKETKKTKVQGAEVDKGKRVFDTSVIDTPPVKVTRTLPQISINLDGPLDIGQMSLAEKLMLATTIQAQASQDLVKFENEYKKLILMLVDVL